MINQRRPKYVDGASLPCVGPPLRLAFESDVKLLSSTVEYCHDYLDQIIATEQPGKYFREGKTTPRKFAYFSSAIRTRPEHD